MARMAASARPATRWTGLVSLDASPESTAYEFRRSMQFAALVYALDREGGTVSCASMSGATILLTLALPGMTKATARGAH